MSNQASELDNLLTELRSGTINFDDEAKSLITQLIDTKVREELELASRVNEQKELDPVISPHIPYRMRVWFKDRIAQLSNPEEN